MKKRSKSKAGRKPLPEGQKKEGLSIYVHGDLITKLGGKDDVRYALSMFALMAGGNYPEASDLWRTIMIHRKAFGTVGGFSLEKLSENIAGNLSNDRQ